MIIGVLGFSFATGALSSILSTIDSSEAKLKEKISTMNSISQEYNIEEELYNKCVKNLRYDHSKKSRDYSAFLNELPYKIKMEVLSHIHRQMYETIIYFQDKNKD